MAALRRIVRARKIVRRFGRPGSKQADFPQRVKSTPTLLLALLLIDWMQFEMSRNRARSVVARVLTRASRTAAYFNPTRTAHLSRHPPRFLFSQERRLFRKKINDGSGSGDGRANPSTSFALSSALARMSERVGFTQLSWNCPETKAGGGVFGGETRATTERAWFFAEGEKSEGGASECVFHAEKRTCFAPESPSPAFMPLRTDIRCRKGMAGRAI